MISWAADLLELKKYSKENKGYAYLLNVIDTFYKCVWAIPIKNKDGVTVSKAFEEKIIKYAKSQNHKAPNLHHIDKGAEFENKLLKAYGIKMYHIQNLENFVIIERFNRTLNNRINTV
jgi:hypothetical protein